VAIGCHIGRLNIEVQGARAHATFLPEQRATLLGEKFPPVVYNDMD